ncbi:unnamed protein product [Colias eurytheme]|nr:unnamed protein product [Colias eurytheme]
MKARCAQSGISDEDRQTSIKSFAKFRATAPPMAAVCEIIHTLHQTSNYTIPHTNPNHFTKNVIHAKTLKSHDRKVASIRGCGGGEAGAGGAGAGGRSATRSGRSPRPDRAACGHTVRHDCDTSAVLASW